MPAFGPGSLEYTHRKAEQLELDGTVRSLPEANLASPDPRTGKYAGAGSYF